MGSPLRIDLHTHSLLSDGALLPSEHARRAAVAGYRAIAITDHADASNLEHVLRCLLSFVREEGEDLPLLVLPGVELTHVPPSLISRLARRARELGAAMVVVHGETLAEPVAPGTNAAVVSSPDVDVLAHPGLVTREEAEEAARNGICLEITSRGPHALTNGHVAHAVGEAGVQLVVNTDAHSHAGFLDQAGAERVACGAGLSAEEARRATVVNPEALIERALARLGPAMARRWEGR